MSLLGMGKNDLDRITSDIIACAIKIHTLLGPGCFESVYEVLLAYELAQMGYRVERQKRIGAVINGIAFDLVFIADMVVADSVIVEIKASEKMAPVFERQLYTQLRLMDKRVGLVLNFGMVTMKEGIRRVVNRI